MSTNLLITVSRYVLILFSTTKQIIRTFISVFMWAFKKKKYASLFTQTFIHYKEIVKWVNVGLLLFMVLSLDLKKQNQKNI